MTILLENAPASVRTQLALQTYANSQQLERAALHDLGVQRFLSTDAGGDDGAEREARATPKSVKAEDEEAAPVAAAMCLGRRSPEVGMVWAWRWTWAPRRAWAVTRRQR